MMNAAAEDTDLIVIKCLKEIEHSDQNVSAKRKKVVQTQNAFFNKYLTAVQSIDASSCKNNDKERMKRLAALSGFAEIVTNYVNGAQQLKSQFYVALALLAFSNGLSRKDENEINSFFEVMKVELKEKMCNTLKTYVKTVACAKLTLEQKVKQNVISRKYANECGEEFVKEQVAHMLWRWQIAFAKAAEKAKSKVSSRKTTAAEMGFVEEVTIQPRVIINHNKAEKEKVNYLVAELQSMTFSLLDDPFVRHVQNTTLVGARPQGTTAARMREVLANALNSIDDYRLYHKLNEAGISSAQFAELVARKNDRLRKEK